MKDKVATTSNELPEVTGEPLDTLDSLTYALRARATAGVSPMPRVPRSDSEITFALTSGGHNAGVVSEPGRPRRSFQVATRAPGQRYVDPERWRADTPTREGSWWSAWQEWLARHSSEQVAPPRMGGKPKAAALLGDAPGSYVLQK